LGRRRPLGRTGWLAAGLTLGSLAFMTELARPFWEGAPPADYLQFSWRLLGFAALGTGLIVAVSLAQAGWWRWPVGTLAAASIVLSTLPGLEVEYLALDREAPSRLDLVRRDVGGLAQGHLPDGEFVPRWRPPDTWPVSASGAEGPAFHRIQVETLEPTRLLLTVDGPDGGRLELPQSYFPGWQATIDGREAAAYPAAGSGLIAVDVPPGPHQVDVRFGETPPRIAGWLIAAASLLALAGWTVTALPAPALRRRGLLIGGATGLVIAAALARQTPASQAAPTPVNQEIAPGSYLLAVAATSRVIEGLLVDLLWARTEGSVRGPQVSLRLYDGSGGLVAGIVEPPYFGFPGTGGWTAGQIVRDGHLINLPNELPAGRYRLTVSADPATEPASVSVDLPAPPQRPEVSALSPAGVTFGGTIALDEFGWGESILTRLRRAERVDQPPLWQGVDPGSDLLIDLRWRALDRIARNYHVFIHLIGSDGRTVAQSDSQPANELAPTSTWRPGDPLADRRRLHLPPDLPPGLYDLRVGLYLLGTHARLMLDPEGGTSFSLGLIKVGRLPEPALPDVPRDVDFGGRLRLIGHDRPELR
ncbi:MAG TPA: hypothetical protein VHL09_08420, partial [Dehalococcoidia bacterium]|nr:hypothetical protein [Dehalococcoidia bacterium]